MLEYTTLTIHPKQDGYTYSVGSALEHISPEFLTYKVWDALNAAETYKRSEPSASEICKWSGDSNSGRCDSSILTPDEVLITIEACYPPF